MSNLKLALWNANGLSQHRLEVQSFLIHNNIDVLLISETHFTNGNNFKINDYTCYNTNHPTVKHVAVLLS